MTKNNVLQVIDRDGVHGTIDQSFDQRSLDGNGSASVLIQLESGERILVPRELLTENGDGSYRFGASLTGLLNQQTDDPLVIPVIEETAHVRHVQTTGKVEIAKRVHERAEVIDEPLASEEVVVERVTINRPVDEAPTIPHEGDTLVIPLLEEVLVVEKRLVLREEVRVRKLQKELRSPQEVSLRSEQIEIIRHPGSSIDESRR